MNVIATGPIPRERSIHWQIILSVYCRRKGHHWRAWLAPPGVLDSHGEQAFRLMRCYRCGLEVAE